MHEEFHDALIASETKFAEFLVKAHWKVEEPHTSILADLVTCPRPSAAIIGAEYYQRLHDENSAYQCNNWLMAELDDVVESEPNVVVEIGCGNGKFSRELAALVPKVISIDWALSPLFVERPMNVSFIMANLVSDDIPSGDIVCSADVLEHFCPSELVCVVAKCCVSARRQKHVIACYDDDHSHLTVMRPAAWLALFWRFCPNAKLQRIDCRNSNARKLACVISS
nr:class I SAM-dependent methyltransferase [uncultured Cohaesibacter sp.]